MDFVPPFFGCRWGLVLGRVDVEKGGSLRALQNLNAKISMRTGRKKKCGRNKIRGCAPGRRISDASYDINRDPQQK
jgi:hypothetical protein